MNEHVKIIQDLVFHSYPYNRMGFKPDAPHAEDCEGCLINAEVKKLVGKLDALSPVEKILDELKHEKKIKTALAIDRDNAFKNASVVGGGSVADLVAHLVDERDILAQLLETIKNDINSISEKFIDEG